MALYETGVPFKATEKSIIETQCDNAKRGRKMHIDEHITDPHLIAAFNDMTLQGTAEFVRRDDGTLLMVIRKSPPGLRPCDADHNFRTIQNGPRRLRRIKGLQWQTLVRGDIGRQRLFRPLANP